MYGAFPLMEILEARSLGSAQPDTRRVFGSLQKSLRVVQVPMSHEFLALENLE
jgi:hypothetical protein